jgi:hypothetical protein
MDYEIYTFVTAAGEFVGRKMSEDGCSYEVGMPRLFMNTAEGSGFLPGVSMTGAQNPDTAWINNVIVAVPASLETEKAWVSATSGIVLQ